MPPDWTREAPRRKGDAGLSPGQLLRQVHDLAVAGGWQAICDLLLAERPDQPLAMVVARAVEASLEAADEEARAWAVGQAIATELPHRMRALGAWRLARAGHAEQSWGVLLAHPAMPWDPEARRLAAGALTLIGMNALAHDALRASAWALIRRMAGIPAAPPEAAPFAFPTAGGPVAPPAFPLQVRLAPGAPAGAVEDILRLTEEAEERLQTRDSPVIEVFRDVFVNRLGQAWRPDGRQVGRTPGILPEGAGAAMTLAPRIAAGILATGASNNLYHWMAAWLPGLAWRFAPEVPADLPILLRDDADSYQAESLDLLAGPALPRLPVGEACHVATLYAVEHRAIALDPAGSVAPMIDRLVAAAARQVPQPPVIAPRLYLSRRDAANRAMANEAELEVRLASLGFVPVALGSYSLAEKIAIFRSAESIVAPHGAGLSMLLAARPGTRVFELMPHLPRSLPTRLCMSRLSRQRGLNHLLWIEPGDERSGTWRVSVPEAVAAVADFIR
ncbi:glycosyltransferase family 61 protein [Roseomonas sp. CAU 1739]|uniref:glycosyltransferase family 61 protein n=1 Tax=Roseomonas sp. CAU 1739 TaxID=3140364 RepID=UPI00325B3679